MFYLVHLPMLAGSLGISTASANQVVNLISAYGTASFVISMIGAVTGVGSIGSGILATVLYLIKKRGKAKAALW
jgi:circularin A/uberolysin family circular bacteriocin